MIALTDLLDSPEYRAERAQVMYEIHFAVCPARLAGRDCVKCQQLDVEAYELARAAESEVSRG